ncbi:MAG: flagellar biosynthetic protein FliR, partial [Candidatus Cloacimonetes bacterium]|nr:flagellar biosynthetic protein FliR [Candidatus Cloacimonadota bacterium]
GIFCLYHQYYRNNESLMFETLGITAAEFEHFLLIMMRITGLVTTLPIFSSRTIPLHVKMVFSLALAFICSSILPVPDSLPADVMILGFLAIKEMTVGLIIGLVTQFIFEGLKLAGFMIGRMMSLSMMTLINPATDETTPVLSNLMYFVAILLLLSTNGHHFFIQTIFDSFYFVPLTEMSFSSTLLIKLTEMFSSVFVIGLKLGAPIFAALFLERVLLGLFAKVTPEIQILIVAMPIAILLGFWFLMFYWPYFIYAFLKLFGIYRDEIMHFIRLLGQ